MSVQRPRAEVQPQRQWFHDFSGRRMGVVWQGGKMTHWMETKGTVESHEPEWSIGSGKEAKNYVIRSDKSLFLSPFSWWASRIIWEMAPGYVIDANPNFFRPLVPGCLECHAGKADPVPGTQNRYAEPAIPEPAIGCDRCHGDPAVHLKDARAGNIVNPAKLPAGRRDAVCDACHLEGEARVFNPGKRFADYRPGLAMEDVFTIYVSKKGADDTVLPVRSHAEEIAASDCATKSGGRLWCGTCHDSHREPAEKERTVWYRDKCLTCHQGEPAETHRRKAGDDCVRCHMPRQRAFDGSHASRTTHWIRTAATEARFIDRGEYLRPWRQPPAALENRNGALAYLNNADKTRSLKRLREGLRLLNLAVNEGHQDGETALAAGLQFIRQERPDLALPWLARAVAAEPGNSLRRLHYAAALANAGKRDEAKQQVAEAIRLEPLLEQAYAVMGQLEPERAAFWKDEYRKAAPKRILP